jgi:glycosyltransferase involved in cell wall biosynthesis
MSVIEGMSAGLAIVTTPVGATTDIISDGVTGLLVQPGDVSALAGALGRLVEDPELRHTLGRAAFGVFEKELEITAYVDRLASVWIGTAVPDAR